MNKFKNKCDKLLELSAYEWWIMLLSVTLLPCNAIALRVFGFNQTKSLLSIFTRLDNKKKFNDENEILLVKKISRMVNIASINGLYRSSCINNSLLLWWLLAMHGITSKIFFGVRLYDGLKSDFHAHSWVEFNGINVSDYKYNQPYYLPLKPVHFCEKLY